jgi:hypothetical protein
VGGNYKVMLMIFVGSAATAVHITEAKRRSLSVFVLGTCGRHFLNLWSPCPHPWLVDKLCDRVTSYCIYMAFTMGS